MFSKKRSRKCISRTGFFFYIKGKSIRRLTQQFESLVAIFSIRQVVSSGFSNSPLNRISGQTFYPASFLQVFQGFSERTFFKHTGLSHKNDIEEFQPGCLVSLIEDV